MSKARIPMALVLAAAGASCGLSQDSTFWAAAIVEGEGGAEVSFCPITGPTGTAGAFVPDVGASALLEVQDDDIHTFSQLNNPQGGPVGTAMFELFGGGMRFDLGPIGLAYDDDGPVQLTIAGVTVQRTLIGGQRKADDEVELEFEYLPSCSEVTLVDGGTCSCAPRTLTWRFSGDG